MNDIQIRKELIKYGKELIEKGLVSGTGGNISARAGNFIYLSPSGFSLDEIKPHQYVKIDLNVSGKKIEASPFSPSCEMPMHLACYRARSDIKAVMHVHPPFAIGLGCAGVKLKALFPDFVVLIGEELPLLPYLLPGSEILGKKVREVLKNNSAVLLQNHGLVTVGKNLREAFLRAEIIEEAAKIYFISCLLGKTCMLTNKEIDDIKKRYKNVSRNA